MASSAGDRPRPAGHRVGDTFRVKGLELTDHFFRVPLDHFAEDGGEHIEVFAREIVSLDKSSPAKREDLPWLVYLQGGPGFECARPVESGGWLAHATESFRVLLMDQRGTGRSTRVSSAAVLRRAPEDAQAQAAYLAHFRADSIVADAEAIRVALLGEDTKWSLLGQSFGGFCITRYLSASPEGVKEAFLTGGLPPLVHSPNAALETYRKLLDRVATQNRKYYRRFPNDVKVVREVAAFLMAADGGKGVKTPSGGRLSVRGLQALGFGLGLAGGFENLHYLLEKAWDVPGEALSYAFLKGTEDAHAFDTNPMYAVLHESIYCNGGGASGWAAERALAERGGEFDAAAVLAGSDETAPVFFTGEMVFPFMFDEIAALTPLKPAAEVLARKEDWPRLYDVDALNANTVPVACASYFEDMFVDFDFATVRRFVGFTRFACVETRPA